MAPPRRSSRGQTKSTKDTNTQSKSANANTTKPKTTRKSAREVISNLRSTRASTRDKQSDKDENNDGDSDASEPSNKRKATLHSREAKDKANKSEKKDSPKELSEDESDEEHSIPDTVPAKKPKTSIAEESVTNENYNVTLEPEITEVDNEQTAENNNANEKDSTKIIETLPLENNNTTAQEHTSPDSGVEKENPLKPTNSTNDLTLPAGIEEFKNSQIEYTKEPAKVELEIKQSAPTESTNKTNQSKETETETETAKCIVSDRPDEVRFVPESTMVVNFELNSKDLKSRLSKFQELKSRMNRSSQENHKEMMLEHERSLVNPKLEAKYQRKYEEAKKLLEKTEAEERGDNYDRNQYWNYSVESVEKWDEKQTIKNERAQNGFTDYAQAAQKKYNRLTNSIKPNLAAYQQNMSQASITPATSGSGYTHSPNYENQITSSHTHVNRPSNVIYGPHTFHSPSNDSVDRLAQFVKQEQAARSQSSKHRKASEDDEINYINDRNQKFNQKIARAYDQHTEDIRESFERGTAL